MRMAYERPMMRAEVFAANHYVAACSGYELDGTMTVSFSQGNWYADLDDDGYGGHTDIIMEKEQAGAEAGLTHSFIQDDALPMENQYGDPQYFWECSDNDGYYLEYSAGYSERTGKEIFFLYKESNGQEGLQLSGAHSWPDISTTYDSVIAAVGYEQGMSPIVNS